MEPNLEPELVLPRPHEEGTDLHSEGASAPDRVQSPFLEGTNIQYAWDSTSLGALKKCPRYYQYKLVEGWTHETGIHLRWGLEFHAALEDYERSRALGIRFDDAVHDTVRALLTRLEGWEPIPRSKSEELKTKEHLLRSVVWYLEHYKEDPAETVILANGKPAVELSFQFELDDCGRYPENDAQLALAGGDPNALIPYLLCGHLDRVVTFGGEKFVMDHKTTSTTPGAYYFDQFEPNNQMSLYALASQVILGAPIKGVMIDVVQIAVGFSRFTRGLTYRTSDQLEEWLETTKHWLRYAERLATDNYWPMNDTACDKFGGCEFKGICSKSPSVRDRFLEAGFERKEPWNPLKPR
jgi:hypothetical protein